MRCFGEAAEINDGKQCSLQISRDGAQVSIASVLDTGWQIRPNVTNSRSLAAERLSHHPILCDEILSTERQHMVRDVHIR
jgi:hypothetical protein